MTDGKDENEIEKVSDAIGAVQGSEAGERSGVTLDDEAVAIVEAGTQPDAPAPDAGEIEWAGQVVKKPPAPQG